MKITQLPARVGGQRASRVQRRNAADNGRNDALGPMKGVLAGALLSAILWGVIGLGIYCFVR